MSLSDSIITSPLTNTTSGDVNHTTTQFPHFHLNQTDVASIWNQTTGNWTDGEAMAGHEDSGVGLSASVIVAISVGTTAFFLTIITVTIFLIRKKFRAKKNKAWEDNLTLSYIADSNIDLTKDNFDEMVSLDNDSFLNSLDTHSFSVFSPDSNTRQYTYSYF